MNRYILAAISLLMLLSGCEYHPYYDGQILRIYQNKHGLIEADGTHLYVPIVDRNPYRLEIYGGKGKNHKVTISNPELIGYTYTEADIETFLGNGPSPAVVTLEPRQIGDTVIEILDEDTGESIRIDLHIVKVFNMMQIEESHNSLGEDIVIAFDFPTPTEDIKLCRKISDNFEFECIVEAKCRFIACDTTAVMELTYLADENEQPDPDGSEIVKNFYIEDELGNVSGYPSYTLRTMNLNDMGIQTKKVYDEYDSFVYDSRFRFIEIADVTDSEIPDGDSPDTKMFYASSAQLTPWI